MERLEFLHQLVQQVLAGDELERRRQGVDHRACHIDHIHRVLDLIGIVLDTADGADMVAPLNDVDNVLDHLGIQRGALVDDAGTLCTPGVELLASIASAGTTSGLSKMSFKLVLAIEVSWCKDVCEG